MAKSAIITGGSRGIGKEICLELASLGMNITVNYIGAPDEANEVVKLCEEKGVKAIAVLGDVTKTEDVDNVIAKTLEAFGTVDVLVNNAGITKDNLIIRMSEEDFDAVINVNLRAAFLCMKAVSKIMMKQKSGKIINISSVVGITGNAGQTNYSASKAGLIGMTKTLARELAGRGVLVNAVAPGFIETDMTKKLPEQAVDKLKQGIPLGKLGSAKDVAKTVAFLASESADYITGQVIPVDGGMVM